MPALSKKQQEFFAMILAYKRGQLKHASARIKKAAASLTLQQVKDYAETPRKGLPTRVKHKKGHKKI